MPTDNIFADLGLDNAEELLARSDLLSEVSRLITTSKLSQKEIADILDISQPKVSFLVSGKLSAFSADTLLHSLTILGCNVEIRIHSSSPLSHATNKGWIKVCRAKQPLSMRHSKQRAPKRATHRRWLSRRRSKVTT